MSLSPEWQGIVTTYGRLFSSAAFLVVLVLGQIILKKKRSQIASQSAGKRKKLETVPQNTFEICLADCVSRNWALSNDESMAFMKQFLKHEFIGVGHPVKEGEEPSRFLPTRGLPLKGDSTGYFTVFTSEAAREKFMADAAVDCWLYRFTGKELLKYAHVLTVGMRKLKKKFSCGLLCNPGDDTMFLWKSAQMNGFGSRLPEMQEYFKRKDVSLDGGHRVGVSRQEIQIDYESGENLEIKTLKTGQRVRLRTPRETPHEFLAELTRYFCYTPAVKFSYLGWLRIDDDPDWHYMLGLDFEEAADDFLRKQIVNEISCLIEEHIAAQDYVDIFTVNDSGTISAYLKTNIKPFYIRENIRDLSIFTQNKN